MTQLRRIGLTIVAVALFAGAGAPAFAADRGPKAASWSGAPAMAQRPMPRPSEVAEAAPASAAASLMAGDAARPRSRPDETPAHMAEAVDSIAGPSTPLHLYPSLRPEARPSRVEARVSAAQPTGRASRGAALHNAHDSSESLIPAAVVRPAPGLGVGTRGAVCGVPGITGETVSPIGARRNGCGIANPVKITAVNGVRLSQAATMDCDTARALNTWVQRGLKPAFGATGGGVTGLDIAGSYVCRTRNHRAGAKISEHGRGRAVDISGIRFANGTRLSILRDWRGNKGSALRAAHRAACGIFGTTLGPGSDGMHEDHLHFDTARHRNGAYCR